MGTMNYATFFLINSVGINVYLFVRRPWSTNKQNRLHKTHSLFARYTRFRAISVNDTDY